jgi:hypothetical protein
LVRAAEHLLFPTGSASGGDSSKTFNRDQTKTGNGNSSDSSGTGRSLCGSLRLFLTQSAGGSIFLSDCLHTSKKKVIIMLAEYKKERDADKKKSNLSTLRSNCAMADTRDGQISYLTSENLVVMVTVLADTGSGYSAIPRSAVMDQGSVSSPSRWRCCRS